MYLQFFNKHNKKIAKGLMLLMVLNLIPNTNLFALTGGPSQPEVQSFEPVGTSEMVDVSTGDFNYNIPILDIGGYPINLSYHAGVGMDDEASWVGLGWNLNPGVINRQMRGLPDDFNGEEIEYKYHRKSEVDGSLEIPVSLSNIELFGFKKPKTKKSFNFTLKYNNYRGMGFQFGMPLTKSISKNFGINLGLQFSSSDGLSLSPSLSYSGSYSKNKKGASLNIGTTVNSQSGMHNVNFGAGFSGTYLSKLASKIIGNQGFNYNTMSYTPTIQNNSFSNGITASYAAGPEVFGVNGKVDVTGSFNWTKIKDYHKKSAIGVYYEQNKVENENDGVFEINRENDGAYSKYTTNLPVPSKTFDIFSVSGQGVGGSYRIKRGNITLLNDPNGESNGFNSSFGVELGAGSLAKYGANLGASFSNSKSGRWKNDSYGETQSYNAWNDKNEIYGANKDFEPAYFVSSGEIGFMGENEVQLYDTGAVRPNFRNQNASDKDKVVGYLSDEVTVFKKGKSEVIKTLNNTVRTKREKRNNVLMALTNKEATNYGLDKTIKSYNSTNLCEQSERGVGVKSTQFAELTMVGANGSRYIYGIPAYNNEQVDENFNVSNRTKDAVNGLVSYDDGDNTKNNKSGEDHLYTSTKTPKYAHSFLLTGYLSSDYSDITGDGITDDDLGTAVKFNYQKVHDNYKWRVPLEENKANLNEGQKSDLTDDYGMYSYGSKEIWHVNSIETKTQIAMFYLKERTDGLGVLDIDGGKNLNMKSYRLDKIVLFSKQEFNKVGAAAIPIKTVHFNYSYELCPGITNSATNEGKLTLKSLYFTYGTSFKGRTGSYEFKYSTKNPSYNFKSSDGWGSYKANEANSLGNGTGLSNADFPYPIQDKAIADLNASAWLLTEIELPSGGNIRVEYESDDYAYVEDKNAMRMFKITGFSKSNANQNPTDFLYRGVGNHADLMYIRLEKPLTGSNQSVLFRNQYLKNITDLQFTVFTNIDNKGNNEFVKGYCNIDIENSYVLSDGITGVIKMKQVRTGDDDKFSPKGNLVNPIVFTAWNFARIYCDKLINPESYKQSLAEELNLSRSIVLSILKLGRSIVQLFGGQYYNLQQREFCKRVNLNKSWVRLNDPDGFKLGGGHRVKRLFVNDKWGEIGSLNSNATDAEYGTEYTYTTKRDDSKPQSETISSGVASFEPSPCGDENPLRLPIEYIANKLKFAPDAIYYTEMPIGESYYPGAQVIYSKVTSRAISNSNIKRTGSGYTVAEFFTAKDFPVIINHTNVEKLERKTYLNLINSFNYAQAVQGFSIETNDMHGKPKQTADYDEYGKQVGGVKYEYQTSINKLGKKTLSNEVKTVAPNGIVSSKTMGVEIDMVVDTKQSISNSQNFGIALNVDINMVGPFPIPVPSLFPSYSKNKTKFYSLVNCKSIKRYGILKATTAFKSGSNIRTENLLYDAETGDLLLTSVQNEHKDNVYSFTTPAHWAYDKGMGQAYKNIGLELHGVSFTHDGIACAGLNMEDYLVEGDEVYVSKGNDLYLETYHIYRGTGGNLNLIDKNGFEPKLFFGIDYTLKVLRSGRKNQASTPIAQTVTLQNPIVGNTLAFNKVIDASAVEYKDQWQTHLTYLPNIICDTNSAGNEAFQLFNLVKSKIKHTKGISISYKGIPSPFLVDSLRYVYNSNFVYINIDQFSSKVLDSSKTCCIFQYYSSQDSLWRSHDIFDRSWWLKHGVQVYMEYPFGSKNFLCNSSLPTSLTSKLDSVNNLCNTNCCRVFYIINNNNLKINAKLNCNGSCNTNLDPTCILNFNFPSEKLYSIDSTLGYRLATDGKSMFVKVKATDICGKQYITEIEIDKCGENLRKCELKCFNASEQYAINPFRTGIKGNWRPFRNHKFLGTRNYQAGSPNTKTDGQYTVFTPFWVKNVANSSYTKTTNPKWVWSSEITKYSPFGQELETRDALNRYTAELYGFFHTLPTAAAGNAKYTQIAYDGFEDYEYLKPYSLSQYTCEEAHFKFPVGNGASIDGQNSHTGWHSLRLNANSNTQTTKPVIVPQYWNYSIDTTTSYKMKQSDDLGLFSPQPGTYNLSAWVKEDRNGNTTNYAQAGIEVIITLQNNAITSTLYKANGTIIENWQRINATFTVPVNTKTITIKLKASSEVVSWFDDVRIHPNDATMKTFAYDHKTLRNMAALDENNYATFYEYDAEGSLIRVKKETINGIITIQENRTHNRKKN